MRTQAATVADLTELLERQQALLRQAGHHELAEQVHVAVHPDGTLTLEPQAGSDALWLCMGTEPEWCTVTPV